ncbi:MAG: di-trans,poly-cis-decaprenylcistransferase [Oscillospiraceae bacterium]|nr:di-trans,poly-cis-decaprenylcistransferase [Oscillospiraceae bacterium]
MARKVEPPVPADKLPRHVAIIMDGNGRWAKKRGLPRTAGHVKGGLMLRKIIRHAKEIGIEYISFYAFSTENWNRPNDEVSKLMELMRKYLKDVYNFFDERVRFVLLGDRRDFAPDIAAMYTDVEQKTRDFDLMTVGMAANYGSRREITQAMQEIAELVKEGKLDPADITEETISQHLYTREMPDVDLLIRPGSEQRISNFLLWQSAYAELYFCDTLWPDFSPKEFDKAIVEYANRTRRFGAV